MRLSSLTLTTYLFLALLPACSSPSLNLAAFSNQFGFHSLDLNGDGFVLSCFYKPGLAGEKELHVYLEGDGRPWQSGILPAEDLTTRASVMLPLMAQDSASSLYLGRPCYNGHAHDAGCESRLWTSARYGEQVITAMTKGLADFTLRYGYSKLVLIGHSGGGSLALLLSQRLPQTQALITLAGNYDINLWTDYHGYLRLNGSENPADHPNQGVTEWHFLGELDNTIPPQLFLSLLQNRNHSQVEILSNVTHQLGWVNYWPKILSRLKHN